MSTDRKEQHRKKQGRLWRPCFKSDYCHRALRRRSTAKPDNARRSVSAIMAHSESVGTDACALAGGGGGATQVTVNGALAATALLPLLVCNALAGNVLVN